MLGWFTQSRSAESPQLARLQNNLTNCTFCIKSVTLQAVKKSSVFIISILFVSLVVSSCNSYQKVLKSESMEYKYEQALKYYENEEYYKALPILEELITIYKGTKKVDQLYFYYADAQFKQDNFLIAAFHFKNFSSAYSHSQYAEEALYLHALSYLKVSPIYSLDQTYTQKAIDAFQLFINSYPDSDKVALCNNHIDQLRAKLEEKSYENAHLYFKTGSYRASATAFDNLLRDFPGTKYEETARFLIVKSYFLYAENSIDKKKNERYQKAVEAYEEFVQKFDQSDFIKEARQIHESSLNHIEKNKNNG